MNQLKNHYRNCEPSHILTQLPPGYGEAWRHICHEDARRWAELQTKQFKYDPKVHLHETLAGIKTRSKSEAIICNIITSYDIPVLYEKPFPYPAANGQIYSPDFTFELPFGEKYIWEHFGMLNDIGYCEHNAQKLNLYQRHGFLIGVNLFITQDDVNGGINSRLIHEIVKRHILPHFEK